jgi:hypothetical protein
MLSSSSLALYDNVCMVRTAISLFSASSFSLSLPTSSCFLISPNLSSGASRNSALPPRAARSRVFSKNVSCIRIPSRDAFSVNASRFTLKPAMIHERRGSSFKVRYRHVTPSCQVSHRVPFFLVSVPQWL